MQKYPLPNMSLPSHTSSLPSANEQGTNTLFPVFLKLETLSVLLIGGGNIALEKLQAVLGNAPATKIRLVAAFIDDRIKQLAAQHQMVLQEKWYEASDIADADIIIVAVNDIPLSEQIRTDAKQKNILVNVADKPALCDFYLGSIVQKGSLKIAISTNGKSPTIAKRLKEVLNEILPAEMDDVLNNMQNIRQQLNGDFSEKVKQLNELTKVLVAKQVSLEELNRPNSKIKQWQQIVKICLFALVCMMIGAAVYAYFQVP